MNNIFNWIGKRIEKNHIKILLGTILLFGALIIGALNVEMATGNETLVKSDNEVFKSNKVMEENFGGDAIMVLFEGEDQNDLLSIENIGKLWNVEQQFKYEENIFSFMSISSIIHQMTDIQSTKIKEQLLTISDGLGEMAEKMTGVGETLISKDIKDPKEIEEKLTNETSSMASGLSGGINPDELKEMAEGFIIMGEKLGEISEGLDIFHTKSGMMVPNIPATQEELDSLLYDENLELRSIFSDVIIDDNHSIMMVKLQGNLGDEYKDLIYENLLNALEKEEFKDISYIISGKPVLDTSLRAEMKINMKTMVVMAVALMFIILLLVFKIRWRALSLGIIFASVIGTLGFMGTINVPMTMVSMAVFPILIGLGIDYSIQFHNRYEEENSARVTLAQIGKAVGIAVLATVLGFISLYASPVPMIQDFGKMLTIGVVISFIGSIFLLMPILHLRDTFAEQTKRDIKMVDDKPTIIDKILMSSTKFVVKHSILIILVAVIVAGLGIVVDNNVGVETDIETFMPQDMDALKDIHEIRDIVGSTNQMAIYMESEDILSEENISWMKNTIDKLEDEFANIIVDVKSIDNIVGNFSESDDMTHSEYVGVINDLPEAQSEMFLNNEENKAVILMNIKHLPTEELQVFVEDLKDTLEDTPMEIQITGKSALDVEMVKGLTDGRVKMTLIGIGLVFLALLLIYRNPIKAFIPVFPIVLIVGMSGGIMYLLGLKYTPITATLGALILGMGTEMTIMLLERYLEERQSGKDKLEAMLITVTMIGKATVASGLTTIGGFSVLMTSKFVILKDFGLMTVINISLALMSTFIILPAVLVLMDRFIVKENPIETV